MSRSRRKHKPPLTIDWSQTDATPDEQSLCNQRLRDPQRHLAKCLQIYERWHHCELDALIARLKRPEEVVQTRKRILPKLWELEDERVKGRVERRARKEVVREVWGEWVEWKDGLS